MSSCGLSSLKRHSRTLGVRGSLTNDGAVDSPTSIVTTMLVPSRLPKERSHRDLVHTSNSREGLGDEWIEFRPARWLVATVALLWLLLVRPKFGKRALVAVAWRTIPRRLKFIAGGVAGVALVVLAGSVAALVLVLDQLA